MAMENHHFLVGKPSINGPFSMAMLNNKAEKRWDLVGIRWGCHKARPKYMGKTWENKVLNQSGIVDRRQHGI